MTIVDLKDKQKFVVKRVVLRKEIGKRLSDMGFTNGVVGTVIRSALFGDPIEVNILDYNVSIRKSEASGIEVNPI